MVADDTPADPAVVRDLETTLAALSEKLSADLYARIEAQTDAVVQRAVEQQIAALLQKSQQNLAIRREAADRADRQMPTMIVWGNREGGAGDHVDRPVKIASGSLEIRQQALPEGSDKRVERGRLRFEERFVDAPRVALGVRLDDLPRADRPRVAIRVVHVDDKGFDYEVRTLGSLSVKDLKADWVAYASGSQTAPPASAR